MTLLETGELGIPAPPPPAVRENSDAVNHNPNGPGRFLFQIWDRVALFGPITADELYARDGFVMQQSASWALYRQMHGIGESTSARARELSADHNFINHTVRRWHFDHEVAIGLRHGYLVERDGMLAVGPCPPAYEPFAGMATNPADRAAGARAAVTRDENRQALAVLRGRQQIARMRPTRIGKTTLRKSLESVGQLCPIFVWVTIGGESITVDGTTRLELLESLGKDRTNVANGPVPADSDAVWIIELPRTLPAVEVLRLRMEHELATTSKDQSDDTRNAYIAALSAEGFSTRRIGEIIGSSHMTVQRVLSQVEQPVTSETADSGRAARWAAMQDEGWSLREIAHDEAVSHHTVQRHIERYRASQNGHNPDEIDAAEAQAEADAIVEAMAPPSARARTPQGRREQATRLRPMQEAAERVGATPTRVRELLSHSTAATIAAALIADPSMKREVFSILRAQGEWPTDAD